MPGGLVPGGNPAASLGPAVAPIWSGAPSVGLDAAPGRPFVPAAMDRRPAAGRLRSCGDLGPRSGASAVPSVESSTKGPAPRVRAANRSRHEHRDHRPSRRRDRPGRRLGGVRPRPVAGDDRRARLHPAQLHPLLRRRLLPRRPHREDPPALGSPRAHLPLGGAQAARLRRRHRDPRRHRRLPRRVHQRGRRRDRRPPDRRAAQARHDAQRRLAHGRDRDPGGGQGARSADQGDLHQAPQDPQRRRLRHLHPADPRRPLQPHHHRPARRLRPRPHHRRLPPPRPLRRGLPDRGEEGREGRRRGSRLLRALGPLPRGARRADQGAAEARAARRDLRAGPAPPRGDRPGGRAVDLHGLSRLGEEPGRRRDVHRPPLGLPGRVHPAGSHRRHPHRVRGAGDHRRARDQAADRPLPAHHRLRPDLLRRPLLGDLVRRRLRRGRPPAGHQDVLPPAADPAEPRPRPGAEHHDLLGPVPSRGLQGVLLRDLDRDLLDPVRVRRADP